MGMSIATEKDLEGEIWDYMMRRWHCPVCEGRIATAWRQMKIKGYGIPDIVYVRNLRFGSIVTVMELKNTELKPDHVNQLCRYVTGIRRALDRHLLGERLSVRVRGVLVGPMENTDWVWMFQEMIGIDVYRTNITIEGGVQFEEICDWHKRDESLTSLNPMIREAIKIGRAGKEPEPA